MGTDQQQKRSGDLQVCSPECVAVSCRDQASSSFFRALIAEFLATAIFVILGVGSTFNWQETATKPADLICIALCFGLCTTTLTRSFVLISGCHINPAITVAKVVIWELNVVRAPFYVFAQCSGAVIGSCILSIITPSYILRDMGVTKVNSLISVGEALVVEFVITFQLVFTVCATSDPKQRKFKGTADFVIGFAVVVGHLYGFPYTGASMNPARSFGPAFMSWNWTNHWVYWLGPIIGAVVASTVYLLIYWPSPAAKKKKREVFVINASEK